MTNSRPQNRGNGARIQRKWNKILKINGQRVLDLITDEMDDIDRVSCLFDRTYDFLHHFKAPHRVVNGKDLTL